MIHPNETWSFTASGENYVGFRMFLPLAMKKFYGFTKDYTGGANSTEGQLIFAKEYDSLPEQAEVESNLPV